MIEEAFARMSLDVGLKAAALILFTMLFTWALGKKRVLARSAVWNACLLGLLVLPAATVLSPRLRIECLPAPQNWTASQEVGGDESMSGATLPATSLHGTAAGLHEKIAGTLPEPSSGASPPVRKETAALPAAQKIPWLTLAALLYAAGGVVFAARFFISLLEVRKLRRSAAPLDDLVWKRSLERWRRRLEISRQVALSKSDGVSVPVAAGWLHPAILLPEILLDSASRKHRHSVLVHELAHVRRGDYLWLVLLRFLQVVYWPHPLLWAASRSIAAAREEACDDLCVHLLRDPRRYRSTLLEVARLLVRKPVAALGLAMARSTKLGRRIDRIERGSGASRCLSSWPVRALVAFLALACAAAVGSLELARSRAVAEGEGFPLDGLVLDEGDRPVAGATVTQAWEVLRPGLPETSTAADGHFHFDRAKLGGVYLVAEAPGHAPGQLRAVVTKEMAPVKLRLSSQRATKARVVDSAGKPVAGATAEVIAWEHLRPLEWSIKTDDEGRFVWPSAPAGEMRWDIYKKGFMRISDRPLSASGKEEVLTLLPKLHLSGTVVDAGSGEPVPGFKVVSGVQFREKGGVSWQRMEARPFRDGKYEISFDFPVPARLLRIEASGYLPSVSRPFKSEEGEQVFDFRLKKGRGPEGSAQGPGGAPLEDADVIIALPTQPAFITNGKNHHEENSSVLTDADGRFAFAPEDGKFALAVLHEEGYAAVTSDELSTSPKVKVHPWGRIEGKLLEAGKPLVKEAITIYLYGPPGDDSGRQWIRHEFQTATGPDGSFSFDRVPPGEARVVHEVQLNPRTDYFLNKQEAHGAYVEVEEGKTARVILGGTGRAVAGRASVPASVAAGGVVDWSYGYAALKRKLPLPKERPLGADLEKHRAWFEWYKAWWRSDEGKAHRRSEWTSHAPIKPDGSFRIEDVPPGAYELTISLSELPQRMNVIQRPGAEIGSVSREVQVPEGQSSEALEVGVLELQKRRR